MNITPTHHHHHHHHFIVPHCDDAWLTFGGTILSLKDEGYDVTIHVVYSDDIYLSNTFLSTIRKTSRLPATFQSYEKYLLNTPQWQTIINEDLTQTSFSSEFCRSIRKVEEMIAARLAGVELIFYDKVAAFPQRGYESFNTAVYKSDLKHQLKDLRETFHSLFDDDATSRSIYTMSAVGGHPDHQILAKYGIELQQAEKVYFGLDMPYAAVLEWLPTSKIDWRNYRKRYVDVTLFQHKKEEILSKYVSQLSVADIRVVHEFSKIPTQLFHAEHPDGKIPYNAENIEILYEST